MSRNLAHVNYLGNIYLALNGLLILDINSTDYNGFKNSANLSITIGSWSYPSSQVDLIPFEPWVNEKEENDSRSVNKSQSEHSIELDWIGRTTTWEIKYLTAIKLILDKGVGGKSKAKVLF